jgi:hypothetical protein
MLIFKQIQDLLEFYAEICGVRGIIKKSYQIVSANIYLEGLNKVCYAVGKIEMLPINSINKFFFFYSDLYYKSSYKL